MKAPCIFLAFFFWNTFLAAAQEDPGPLSDLLVYKTKRDYTNLVAVTLSEDRSRIINYPNPLDLRKIGKGLLPTRLHDGFFIDNIGIGPNTAFLNITYAQYVNLKRLPSAEELYKYILDKDPLVVLCDCGSRASFRNPVIQLNPFIDKKILLNCCKTLAKKNLTPYRPGASQDTVHMLTGK